ncbi:juxtaposed with another zinc finger protein 1 [Haemaphysalis longicornis]
MAVFLINNCKFNGCGLTFPTLRDLILHIEDTHIDSDPRQLEKQELQQPSCLPVSYVLRVFTEATRVEPLGVIRKRQRTLSPASSICSNTPTGSEMDEEEISSESDDSNDSWTTQNEFISEFIMRMMSSAGSAEEKPFACPVPGCKKRYKNVNGIKYHAKNGHKKEAKIKKAHRCHCGKSYKSAQGLRVHSLSQHSGESQLAKCPDFASALGSTAGHMMAPRIHHAAPLPVVSPTLQQHLLSPLVIRPTIASSFASVGAEG